MNEIEKAIDRAIDNGHWGAEAVMESRYEAALENFQAAIESVQFLIQQEGE